MRNNRNISFLFGLFMLFAVTAQLSNHYLTEVFDMDTIEWADTSLEDELDDLEEDLLLTNFQVMEETLDGQFPEKWRFRYREVRHVTPPSQVVLPPPEGNLCSSNT